MSIHLILIPKMEIKNRYSSIIESTFVEVSSKYNLILKSFAILPDHIHLVLNDIEIGDTSNATPENQSDCIFEMVETIKERVFDIYEEILEWDDFVHVMLMPLGHSEILTSYLKDQENVHTRMTLQEEIEIVFEQKKPNSIENENGFDGFRYN